MPHHQINIKIALTNLLLLPVKLSLASLQKADDSFKVSIDPCYKNNCDFVDDNFRGMILNSTEIGLRSTRKVTYS